MATNPVRKLDAFRLIRAQLKAAQDQLKAARLQDLQAYPDLSTQIDNQFQSVDDAFVDRLAAIEVKITNAKAAITNADRLAYAAEIENSN